MALPIPHQAWSHLDIYFMTDLPASQVNTVTRPLTIITVLLLGIQVYYCIIVLCFYCITQKNLNKHVSLSALLPKQPFYLFIEHYQQLSPREIVKITIFEQGKQIYTAIPKQENNILLFSTTDTVNNTYTNKRICKEQH